MSRISETDLMIRPDGGAYHIGLRPAQVPDLIIGVGDPERVERVSKHFDAIDFKIQNREFVSHRGSYRQKSILVISTGIGTDNVEIVLTELDALVNVDWETRMAKKVKRKLSIVRVGTSGAMQHEISVGSEVASVYAVGLDNLMDFYSRCQSQAEMEISSAVRTSSGINFNPYVAQGSKKLLDKIGFDMVQGNTVTTPGFYAPQGRRVRGEPAYPQLLTDLSAFRHGDFRLANFEMETAAYYALGNLLGHGVLSVNAILVNRLTNEFAQDPDSIVDRLIKKVLERI
jgi:uridine phosphorylase